MSITDDEAKEKLKKLFKTKERVGGCKWDSSKLLKNEYKKDILRLLEEKGGVKFKLLYQGTRDGFRADDFHRFCDEKGPTMLFIQAGATNNLFGGYFEGSWNTSNRYSTQKSFLFSLRSSKGEILKLTPRENDSNHVYCGRSYGPTFGGGHDLYLNSNMTSMSNYCNPYTFKTIPLGYSGTYTTSTLAGAYNFSVKEIEVFSISTKTLQNKN